jgi:hypothetical protein
VNFTTGLGADACWPGEQSEAQKIASGGFAWRSALMTLTSNRSPFFPREGPTGEQCTFVRSSDRCESEDWPVIFDNLGVGRFGQHYAVTEDLSAKMAFILFPRPRYELVTSAAYSWFSSFTPL